MEIANDTPYGLAAYVQSKDLGVARAVAARLRAGTVSINYPSWNTYAPFGGYKQSGNGREYAGLRHRRVSWRSKASLGFRTRTEAGCAAH